MRNGIPTVSRSLGGPLPTPLSSHLSVRLGSGGPHLFRPRQARRSNPVVLQRRSSTACRPSTPQATRSAPAPYGTWYITCSLRRLSYRCAPYHVGCLRSYLAGPRGRPATPTRCRRPYASTVGDPPLVPQSVLQFPQAPTGLHGGSGLPLLPYPTGRSGPADHCFAATPGRRATRVSTGFPPRTSAATIAAHAPSSARLVPRDLLNWVPADAAAWHRACPKTVLRGWL